MTELFNLINSIGIFKILACIVFGYIIIAAFKPEVYKDDGKPKSTPTFRNPLKKSNNSTNEGNNDGNGNA